MKNTKKHKTITIKAFTLAEVLITLLVIGVVASFVIPTIIADFEEQYKVSSVKKVYSVIQQSILRIRQEYGGSLIIFNEGESLTYYTNEYKNLFRNYISFTKDCNDDAQGTCWHLNTESYKINGEPISTYTGGWYHCAGLITNDGMLYRFYFYSPNCDYLGKDICGVMHVDINGFKKPNKICDDIYTFYIGKQTIDPDSCTTSLLKQ